MRILLVQEDVYLDQEKMILGGLIKEFYEKHNSNNKNDYNVLISETIKSIFSKTTTVNVANSDASNAINETLKSVTENFTRESKPLVRLWHSSDSKSEETAKDISEILGDVILDKREHMLLCKQQLGLFNGLTEEQQASKFLNEYNLFQRNKEQNEIFFVKYPMGESLFDVACRIHQSFFTFHRDAEEHGINDIIVVCDETVSRLFVMMWRHFSIESFFSDKKIRGSFIRLLDTDGSNGYIYLK